jgi:hypothetical protein
MALSTLLDRMERHEQGFVRRLAEISVKAQFISPKSRLIDGRQSYVSGMWRSGCPGARGVKWVE